MITANRGNILYEEDILQEKYSGIRWTIIGFDSRYNWGLIIHEEGNHNHQRIVFPIDLVAYYKL